jgi:tyrosyl-tRNA synthetase
MCIIYSTVGVRRRGKSLGNYVGISEAPEEMYGKIMSIPDTLISRWAMLLLGEDRVAWDERVQTQNPRDVKADLALRLVARFWGDAPANDAQASFNRRFREHQVPDDMPLVAILQDPWKTSAIECVAWMPDVPSKQEARRLLQQGAVFIDGIRVAVTDTVEVRAGSWLRIGRRRYYRLTV